MDIWISDTGGYLDNSDMRRILADIQISVMDICRYPYASATASQQLQWLSYSTEKSGYLDTGYFDSYIYETWQLQPIIITLKIGNVLMSKVTQNYSDLCLSNRNHK